MTQPPDERFPPPSDPDSPSGGAEPSSGEGAPPADESTPPADEPTVAWSPPETETTTGSAPPDPPASPIISADTAPPSSGGWQVPGAPPPLPPGVGAGWQPPYSAPQPAGGGGWQLPTSDVAVGVGQPGFVISSLGSRFVAWLIDELLSSIVPAALFFFVFDWQSMFRQMFDQMQFDANGNLIPNYGATYVLPLTTDLILVTLIGLGVQFLYFVGFWTSRWQATPGQIGLKIRVVDSNTGGTLSVMQASKRFIALGYPLSLLVVVPVLGSVASLAQFGLTIFLFFSTVTNERRQGIHDKFAGSLVIRSITSGSGATIVGCLVYGAMVILIGVIASVAFLSVMSPFFAEMIDRFPKECPMTDQERPPEPGGEPNATPEPEQPTVGWTVPTQPGDPPVPPGAVPPVPPMAGVPPPPPIDPPAPAAGSGWSAQPPAPPPVPAGGDWSQPAPPPSAPGPLLSATPSGAPPAGWATQPTSGQREIAPGLVFSSTVSRLAAYLVDGLIIAIVTGIVTSPVGSTSPITSTGQFTTMAASPIAVLIGVVLNAVYFIGFWSGGRRATLGQMLFKIQVGNAFDGKPLTLEQAGKRWLGLGHILNLFAFSAGTVLAAGGLGAIWALVLLITTATSPTKQGLHDRFANSALVRPSTAGDGLAWTCLILVFILPIVIAVIAIVGLIAVGSQVSTILSAVGESV